MNRILVLICFVMVSLCGYAQMEHRPSVSTSQTGGRFEIIQSPIARKLTFRLDKFTGDVYQLILDKYDKPMWNKISNFWVSKLVDDSKKANNIRFQLFMSGKALADCFLLDIETGITFILSEDTESGELFFAYMKDPDLSILEN